MLTWFFKYLCSNYFRAYDLKVLTKFLPLAESLGAYTNASFRRDLVAGLTVGVMLVPQAMAYAYLAGVPPIYGLYASVVPLIIYAVLGSSRRMSVGPVAVSALLVLAGVSQIESPGTARYVQLVITCGYLIGVLQFLLGLFRMGFLVNFLSHPVVAGFTSAAAFIILFSQMGSLLGVKIPQSDHLLETASSTFWQLHKANMLTVAISIASIAIILGSKFLSKRLPGPLIAVALGTVLSYYLNWQGEGVAIIGGVPEGLPSIKLPFLDIATVRLLMPTVLTVTIIGIVESYGIAKVLESKHRSTSLRPNQELFALGTAKILGAFFQAIPTSGSFSRSAVNDQSGAKTQVSSLVSAALVVLTLLFLTKLFYYMPKAILAAIIAVSVLGLLDIKEAKFLWKSHRRDFVTMMVTFVLTLALGIERGVLIGVVLSLVNVIWKSAYPHVAVLGKVPGKTYYRNIERFENAEQEKGLLMVRMDDQLFFGNASYFKEEITELINSNVEPVNALFIDAKSIKSIDSSAAHTLQELYAWLNRKDIEVYICAAIGPVRDMLERSGLRDLIGSENHFTFLHDAVEHHKDKVLFGPDEWLAPSKP